MKLYTDESANNVRITAVVDESGDVEINANGVTVLWVLRDGRVGLNSFEKESLKQMGFILDGDGQVRTDG